jgi:processive 1,2-diacylglycerol beta-glucosyltransferase
MERRKTILFLPFLQIPSGHYQAAKALMEGIRENQPHIHCEVADILSYSYGKIEALVSKTYLKWIKAFPKFYGRIYRNNVYNNLSDNKRFRLYELLFLKQMRKLLLEKQPNLIVCTHALPSYMLNILKEKGEISVPIINVYTDYFIHHIWGTRHIDYHFAPTYETKEFLKQKGVKESQIFLTGIPTHPKILKTRELKTFEPSSRLSVLITGGSLGVGPIEDLVSRINGDNRFHFYILCGTNMTLYQKINQLRKSNMTPLKYIQSREQMNDLYNKADAIVTKPGGVTVSECLLKGIPIFIYHALPGQEEINLKNLDDLGLIIHLRNWKEDNQSLEDHLSAFFQDKVKVQEYQRKIQECREQITEKHSSDIMMEILGLLEEA